MPTLPGEVKWGEDNSIEAAPVLSEEDREILKQRMLVLEKDLAVRKLAKYKIELFFSHRRTGRTHTPGAISLWESGTKLHGGGDCKIYLCPSKAMKKGDCNGIIPDAAQGYGHLVCPDCKRVWKGKHVHGEIFARLTLQGWATLLYKFFVRLGMNADVYVKVPKMDIRKAATLEQEKQWMGEKLTVARTKRDVYIYPLKHIIKDVNAGADVLGRFRALLSA